MHPDLNRLFSLAGRVAVITGGSSGIGAAMAQTLAQVGADIVLVSRRTDALRRTTEKLRTDGARASWISADLADRAATHRVADEVFERHGQVDVLVNAAGINIRPPLDQLSEADWDLTMAVNVDAAFVLGQRFGPRMADRGWGRILNIASQQSVRAFNNSGVYGVSKAATVGLTRSQAEAWSNRGVCVNAVAPGFVHTSLTEAVFRDPERAAAMSRRTMIGRNGEVGDFAGVTLFLASDASAYVTGQIIFVDGGFSVS